ncbi:MAG: DUF3105 domain-containing protein [Candidatus Sungbacteria bacterium]|nr:DUF3105 domain-containing protein [Candidatus Sungbacteria bacterium]
MAEVNPTEARIRAATWKKRIKSIAGWGIFLFVLLAIIGGAVWYQKRSISHVPGKTYEDIGNQHIALSAPLPKPYNSNPPSSGAHFASPANWGVYDYEVNDKIFIHNLEHGGIWISYRPSVPTAVLEELGAIIQEYGGSKLVMAPRSANDMDIAVAAWTHVYAFNLESGALADARKEEVRAFYRAYKNRGPEFVPDSIPGVDPKAVQ